MACLLSPFADCCGLTLCEAECERPKVRCHCCTCLSIERNRDGTSGRTRRARRISPDSKTGASESGRTRASTTRPGDTTATSRTSSTRTRQPKPPTRDGCVESGMTTPSRRSWERRSSAQKPRCYLEVDDRGTRCNHDDRILRPGHSRCRSSDCRKRYAHRPYRTSRTTESCRSESVPDIPLIPLPPPGGRGAALESKQ